MVRFELKGAKRRAPVLGFPQGEEEPADKRARGPLVIPLAPALSSSASASAEPADLTQRAARELLAELGQRDADADSLVIAPSEAAGARGKRRPLLLANIAPEVVGAAGEEEKFRVDLAMRAPDVDVHSASYQAIPVESFGAALLRGMGWHGEREEGAAEARKEGYSNRLGLGAVAKPPDAKHAHKPGNRASSEAWALRGEERVRAQTLREGDLVWLRAEGLAGVRARVVAVRGVAGLDRVRVLLEDGRTTEVRRAEAVLEEPAGPAPATEPSTAPSIAPSTEAQESALSVEVTQPSNWLRAGIRVRVVSRRASSAAYLAKGTVTDVFMAGAEGALLLDGGAALDRVKCRHLETVLPRVGALGVLLAGARRGQLCRLLEKDRARGEAVLRLEDELLVLRVPMDELAALAQEELDE